jgi:hypothetical protein
MARPWSRAEAARRAVADVRLAALCDGNLALDERAGGAGVVAAVLGFDFGCLLAALRATGADPRPSLVLLAYSAANIVALLPFPGRTRPRGGKP